MDNIDTSIRIKKETRDRLLEMGKKGESYDAIINRLLKVYTLHT